MARTRTYAEAIEFANKSLRRNLEDSLAAIFCSAAIDYIWQKYDWRESLARFYPFALTPGEQDYGPPQYATPSDFLGLRTAQLWDVDTERGSYTNLVVRGHLEPVDYEELPSLISYEPEVGKIRVYPRVPWNTDPSRWIVQGEYKRQPSEVGAMTLAVTTLPWLDMYFLVYCKVLEWVMKGAPIQEKPMIDAVIDDMAANEGYEINVGIIAPSEPLVWTGYSYY